MMILHKINVFNHNVFNVIKKVHRTFSRSMHASYHRGNMKDSYMVYVSGQIFKVALNLSIAAAIVFAVFIAIFSGNFSELFKLITKVL